LLDYQTDCEMQEDDENISQSLRRHGRRRELWEGVKTTVGLIFQISVIVAVISFFQRQEPQVERAIDHQTKVLTLSRAGWAPVGMKIYAIAFDVGFTKDAAGHFALNPTKPIDGVSTRGMILDQVLWYPWSSITVNLVGKATLPFDEWTGGDQPSPYTVYCLAIEARNKLSNQSAIETVLTDKAKFSASMFGPIGPWGAMGGGYPGALLSVERQISADCRAFYEKIRF
jgi:hypothetical protein